MRTLAENLARIIAENNRQAELNNSAFYDWRERIHAEEVERRWDEWEWDGSTEGDTL